jgi:hypothetical protein
MANCYFATKKPFVGKKDRGAADIRVLPTMLDYEAKFGLRRFCVTSLNFVEHR